MSAKGWKNAKSEWSSFEIYNLLYDIYCWLLPTPQNEDPVVLIFLLTSPNSSDNIIISPLCAGFNQSLKFDGNLKARFYIINLLSFVCFYTELTSVEMVRCYLHRMFVHDRLQHLQRSKANSVCVCYDSKMFLLLSSNSNRKGDRYLKCLM